ncbi:MAG TPA: RdgB/HAM1 family non-canonical purine NTP pyrophosphatase [Pyrinomonadaceae bacterium]|jgi:XTP/dITP diphosphohydrolase|nr:RdgB/HAM1 family non-canonical purine NTP pyrophosphatase [Pyrinomonadaceae bacterium]
MPPELLIATRNPGKVRELESLLGPLPLRLRSLAEFPSTREVEETGSTFEENAAIKAQAYAAQTACWTLADDSGLEVEALGGAPGVLSARYGGAGATDAERVELLLNALARTRDTKRRARFVCVVAIADDTAKLRVLYTGTCEGHISHAPRGDGGFGYDPVFVPDGYEESFGELPFEIKQSISHRARALKAAQAYLLDHFGAQA